MLQQIEKTRDPEAVLLARVYALILAWSNTDEPNEPRDAELTRVRLVESHTRRAENEVSDDEK